LGLLPQTPPKGTFCKKSPWESRKTAFDFYCFGFTDCSQGIKRPAYMPPARLRRLDTLNQRIARSTRKIAIGDSLRAVQHEASPLGLLPQAPPKGTFCKKSPWESRKTAFYFQRLHQGIKRPAYTPPAFDGLYFLRMYPSYLL